MAILYVALDNAINESFVDTASREYILKHCEQMGMDISSFDASYGKHLGVFDVDVEVGSRWNCDLYNYEVLEYLGDIVVDIEDKQLNCRTYAMKCETAGTAPNTLTGDLTPITYIPDGLSYAVIAECLIEGENETSDEDIKTAYYKHVNDIQTDGNVAQYEQWCREFDGIGNHKVIPLWNGSNTVKVSILSASNQVATDELLAEFQKYLDPGTTGMGDGQAPIGAFVTVSTATAVPISISASVKFADGYDDTTTIDDKVKAYFAEISYKKNVLSYMSLGAEILKTEGVEFINDLKINGGTSDIAFAIEEIPSLGNTQWNVV